MQGKTKTSVLTIAALGVVFGDIGTSPLYAFKECLSHGAGADEVLGILSLILWSLILLVSVKYIGLILRADNNGEGGILALLSLAFPKGSTSKSLALMTGIGLFGAALLYGDGVITPAISVLSAVEGLTLISPHFEKFSVPIAVIILIGLFTVQRFGTGAVGKVFGRIILVWFATLFVLGAAQVYRSPGVLVAFNPLLGIGYLLHHSVGAILVLGSVFLAVTGGEALYADMGHFGRKPIRLAWAFVVFPSLAMNYLGQGALVLAHPEAAENPFYMLVPKWGLLPMVLLATVATVIASQALISGAFSLTMQAVQMGYLPRTQILHTNKDESGQIFIPQVNTSLAFGCILLVISFGSSSALASAYGIAVTLTMLATTALFYFAARRVWNWSIPVALITCGIFATIEISFFASNMLKVMHGGWLTLAIGLTIFYMMSTWKTGREFIRKGMVGMTTLDHFVDSIAMSGVLDPALAPHRIKGTAVFLNSNPNSTPNALVYNLMHNKVLHDRNIVLSILTDRIPYVATTDRVAVEEMPHGFFKVVAHFGFMEMPGIEPVILACAAKGLEIDAERSTFFLGRETLIRAPKGGLPLFMEGMFIALSRNAQNAAEFFKLPTGRTIEIGRQVEI